MWRTWPGFTCPEVAAVLLGGTMVGLLAPLIVHDAGPNAGMRFVAAGLLAMLLLPPLLSMLRRRVGPEPNTLANIVTLSRLVAGCVLAAFVVSGARDRIRLPVVLIWLLVVLAATVSDWVDGPLARREGATRFGAVLDIESDSWLTLWCAGAAVALSGLPWMCLLPPLARYMHPLLDLRSGKLPAGGGPWWSRVTGVAQMAMLLAAIAPVAGEVRDAVLAAIVWPVSLAQMATVLALLALRRE